VAINYEPRAKHNAAQYRSESTQHISEEFGRAAGEYRKRHSFLIATDAIEITPGGIFVQEKVDGYDEYHNHDYRSVPIRAQISISTQAFILC
jgi:cupin superfamily acireductone dioxygenase involved in methionine salvage